jgi:rod shape-determining protein MreC
MIYRPFFIITFVGLLIWLGANWLQPVSSVVNLVIGPVLAAETGMVSKGVNFFRLISTIREINKENSGLRLENSNLAAELTKLKEMKHENEALRQELGFVEKRKDNYLPAQIIGRTPTGIIKDLIIDRGSADGIKTGAVVLAQGFLIGRISKVEARQASVMLLVNPRSMIPVVLQESRSTGLLRGGISGLVITDLLIDSKVTADEIVLSNGFGDEIPADIAIGRVISTSARSGDITKKATVRTLLDISKQEMVFVRKD